MPKLTPVTTQDGELVEPAIVTALPLAVVQPPPGEASLSVIPELMHMAVAPVMAGGAAFT